MNTLTLARYGIEPSIIIPETDFFTLSIENKEFLLRILNELKEKTEGKESENFNLLLNEKPISIEKSMAMIFDFTDIDFNSKSITNLLIKKFSDFLGQGEQAQTLSNVESILLNLTEDFRLYSGLNVESGAVINAGNIAKVSSLKIADDKRDLIIRLYEYVNLICDLKPLKLFVLVFGKAFLGAVDIAGLYQHCFDKNVRLLIIEGSDKTELQPNERRLIIDSDLCTIPQGFKNDVDR